MRWLVRIAPASAGARTLATAWLSGCRRGVRPGNSGSDPRFAGQTPILHAARRVCHLALSPLATLRAVELSYVTSGESHGPGITAVVSGLPAGLALDREAIRTRSRRGGRRATGAARGRRSRQDDIEILGGVRHGLTLGGPLALIVRNRDHANWGAAMSAWPVTEEELAEVAARRSRKVQLPRPGHADLSGVMKYGLDDVRNVLERASARETSARVAVGAITKGLLALLGIGVFGRVLAVGRRRGRAGRRRRGGLRARPLERDRVLGPRGGEAHARRDRHGGGRSRHARRDHRDPRLRLPARASARTPSRACGSTRGWRPRPSSIQAMKGVEIGDGVRERRRCRGSAVHDELQYDDARGYWRETNRAGGIEGGMSNGEPIVVRIAMKPLPTLMKPLRSARLDTHEAADALVERSDTTAIAAAAVVGEAVVAFELARCVREKFGGDSRRTTCSPPTRTTSSASRGTPARGLERPIAVAGFMGAGKTTVGRAARAAPRPAVRRRATPRSSGARAARCARSSSATARPPSARSRRRSTRELLAARRRAGDRARRRRAASRGDARAAARARVLRLARRRRSRPPGSASTAPRARGRWPATARRSSSSARARAALRGGRRRDRRRRRRRPRTSPARSPSRSGRAPGSRELALGRGRRRDRRRRARARRARGAVIALEGGEAAKSLAGLERALARARRARARAQRRDRVRRRRLGDRRRRLRRGDVPARRALARGAVDARRPGRRGDRRQDRDQRRRQERRRRVLAAARPCSAIPSCSRRCRRASGRAAWPRSIKTALLAGGRLWELVEGWEPGLGDVARRSELVQRCAGVKTLVVAGDPEDRGRRAILNLGHTIGHGVESVAGYGGLSHGECVAIGLVAALRLSEQLAGLARGHRGARRRGCCERHGLPVRAPGLDPGRGAGGDAPRQEAHARARTGWCCWRRSGGPSTASRSARTCSPTPYALATAAPTRLRPGEGAPS